MDIDKLWEKYSETLPDDLPTMHVSLTRLAFHAGILFYIKELVTENIDTDEISLDKASFVRVQLDNQMQVHNAIAVQYFNAS